MKRLTKEESRNQDWMWRSIYNMPADYKYAGHYKDKPIFTHPDVPDGIMYFVNDDILSER